MNTNFDSEAPIILETSRSQRERHAVKRNKTLKQRADVDVLFCADVVDVAFVPVAESWLRTTGELPSAPKQPLYLASNTNSLHRKESM